VLSFTHRPRFVARLLACTVAALVLLSVVGQVVRHRATDERVRSVALLFKLSAEHTVPAYSSAAMLLASAGLLWANGRAARAQGRPFVGYWFALAAIFAYLSVDEALALHERAAEPVRAMLGRHAVGVLYYAWVIPGAAVVATLGFVYLRFLLHLPAVVRDRVLIAGALYVGGAIGMEMVGSYFASTVGTSTLRYAASALVEESMEMLGVVVFIDALLIQLGAGTGGVGEAPRSSVAEFCSPTTGRRGGATTPARVDEP
jgi:hypothetical protein